MSTPYPPSLKAALKSSIDALDSLPQVPFDTLKNLTQLGILPMGSAYLFQRFFQLFRALNPTCELKIISDNSLAQQIDFGHDPHITYLSPPTSTDLTTFKTFQTHLQQLEITPWLSFIQTPSAFNEHLALAHTFTKGLFYFFTVRDILIETTQSQRIQHQLAQNQFNQMCTQYWANAPLYKRLDETKTLT